MALRIVSLGAGVQSSALLLLERKTADCAIFADTGSEPAGVYEWLDFLEKFVAPFPIYRVSNGNLGTDAFTKKRFASMPMFMPGETKKVGKLRRQCSNEYKLKPIRKKLVEMGAHWKRPVDVCIGFSTDEAQRMKPSTVKYARNIFPLIERNWCREQCLDYVFGITGRRPPKSACVFCPLHAESQWLWLKRNDPEGFEQACQFDEDIRTRIAVRNPVFLHKSLRPLRTIEFLHEKQTNWDPFTGECEGMCGL